MREATTIEEIKELINDIVEIIDILKLVHDFKTGNQKENIWKEGITMQYGYCMTLKRSNF